MTERSRRLARCVALGSRADAVPRHLLPALTARRQVASTDVTRPISMTPPPDAAVPAPHPDAPPLGAELGPHYARCFGCGDEPPGGLRMRFTAGAGMTVSARFEVTEQHQGAPGLAHGGLLACAFDEALGALSFALREPMVTGRLETDFRRPVPVGSTLHIVARVDGRAGRKVYVSADGHLDAPDGPVAVAARALYVIVPLSHFVEHGRRQEIEAAAADPVLSAQRHISVNP